MAKLGMVLFHLYFYRRLHNPIPELEDFCKRLSDEMLFGLYISSVNDGYGSVEKYAKGFEVVRQESRIRHHQLIKTDNPGIPSFTL